MIQRKQTLFLLLSIIFMIACQCMQIGTFEPDALGAKPMHMFNLCIVEGESYNFVIAGLFATLAASTVLSVFNIFGYNNRKKQSRQCLLTSVLLLLWIALYAALGSILCPEGFNFKPNYVAAAMPLLAFAMQLIARRGIIADEKLIRSVDRIR